MLIRSSCELREITPQKDNRQRCPRVVKNLCFPRETNDFLKDEKTLSVRESWLVWFYDLLLLRFRSKHAKAEEIALWLEFDLHSPSEHGMTEKVKNSF